MSFTVKQFLKHTKATSIKISSHFNLPVNDVWALMSDSYCDLVEEVEDENLQAAPQVPRVFQALAKAAKAPKGSRGRSAYYLFYDIEKLNHSGRNATALTKLISAAWKLLTDAEKKAYQDQSDALKLAGGFITAKKKNNKRKAVENLEAVKAGVDELINKNDVLEAEVQDRLDNYTVMSQHRDPLKKKQCLEKLTNQVKNLKEQKKTMETTIIDDDDELQLFEDSEDENDNFLQH